jgi:hydrogenase expression/formation protein HypC
MCLAIPAKVMERLDNNMATVDIMGVQRKISLDMTPEAENGDFVLVHAGFSLQVVSEQDAQETLELLAQIPMFQDEELGAYEALGELAEGA